MKKAERTKNYIIEQSAKIFNSNGYSRTSLSDITKELGLTKGAIYGHFENKVDLVVHVFEYNLNQLNSIFEDESQDKKSAIEKLLVYPEVFRKIHKTVLSNGGCPILNTCFDVDETFPVLKELANKALIDWQDTLVNIINEGINNNEINSSIDPEESTVIIISLLEGGGWMYKITQDKKYFFSALNKIEDLINNEFKK